MRLPWKATLPLRHGLSWYHFRFIGLRLYCNICGFRILIHQCWQQEVRIRGLLCSRTGQQRCLLPFKNGKKSKHCLQVALSFRFRHGYGNMFKNDVHLKSIDWWTTFQREIRCINYAYRFFLAKSPFWKCIPSATFSFETIPLVAKDYKVKWYVFASLSLIWARRSESFLLPNFYIPYGSHYTLIVFELQRR